MMYPIFCESKNGRIYDVKKEFIWSDVKDRDIYRVTYRGTPMRLFFVKNGENAYHVSTMSTSQNAPTVCSANIINEEELVEVLDESIAIMLAGKVDMETHCEVDNYPDGLKDDMVNHPTHYTSGKIECIDAMLEAFGASEVESFCKLNAFKYIWRAEHKGGMEDIKKAVWYLNKYISLSDTSKENKE